MSFVKESFIPTLIILAAAALVVLASIPLAQTDWAEGFRSGFGGEGAEQVAEAGDGEREGGDMGAFIYLAPLIKVTILMGIGGLLTALVWGIIKLVSRSKRVLQRAR
jgi:hypothetical protein